jgi:hypothetical protein
MKNSLRRVKNRRNEEEEGALLYKQCVGIVKFGRNTCLDTKIT